jgi:hypothetical protein
VADEPATVVPHTEATLVRKVEDVPLPDVDTSLSTEVVAEGELEGVPAGTPIEELTLPQIKALAKAREIVLGARKDKKADALQALRDGR